LHIGVGMDLDQPKEHDQKGNQESPAQYA
jgi:hypothetical protein